MEARLKIGIVGSGITGMSAAWLLNEHHDVTLIEADDRIGGHTNTVEVERNGKRVAVDTGFIVFNQATYPNLTALFAHLGVETTATEMTFAASMDRGGFEYSGSLAGMFAQRRNLFRPRLWSMVRGILRFYKEAPELLANADPELTLGRFLTLGGYSESFVRDHLLPMGAAIWSTPDTDMLDYPAVAFIRFCENHGLLELSERPKWRTVTGGGIEYAKRLLAPLGARVHLGDAVDSLLRTPQGVMLRTRSGKVESFDHVILACHADQSYALLRKKSSPEKAALGAFRYQPNRAVLHQDPSLMPKRKSLWSCWNYLGGDQQSDSVSVTYWMNDLQHLDRDVPLFVTLNPNRPIREDLTIAEFDYEHPVFDQAAISAQRSIWDLQGQGGVWFAGAWCGAGFHEDGLQAGLAVAEALGGVRRPWTVEQESGRIALPESWSQRCWRRAA